jgi:hypothetical protein
MPVDVATPIPDDTETPEEPLAPAAPPPVDGLPDGAVWPQAVAAPITKAATAAARAKRRRPGYLRDTFMARSLQGIGDGSWTPPERSSVPTQGDRSRHHVEMPLVGHAFERMQSASAATRERASTACAFRASAALTRERDRRARSPACRTGSGARTTEAITWYAIETPSGACAYRVSGATGGRLAEALDRGRAFDLERSATLVPRKWPTAPRAPTVGSIRCSCTVTSRQASRKGRHVTRSITDDLLDLTQGLRTQTAEASLPEPTHVETELQRLVSHRLGSATDGEPVSSSRRGSRSLRARMQRKESIAGAFDSPQGFVFISDAVSHRRT